MSEESKNTSEAEHDALVRKLEIESLRLKNAERGRVVVTSDREGGVAYGVEFDLPYDEARELYGHRIELGSVFRNLKGLGRVDSIIVNPRDRDFDLTDADMA